MQTLPGLIAAGCLVLACVPAGDEEIAVTREQLGDEWPLQVNSALVSCGASGVVLRLGAKRYALDERALASGLPDAREVVAMRPNPDDPDHSQAPADLAPLRAACDGLAHVASER